MYTRCFLPIFLLCLAVAAPSCGGGKRTASGQDWTLRPIQRLEEYNPVLAPDDKPEFYCPIRKQKVRWQAKDVFNPAAVVKGGRVYLLFRAEDKVGKFAGTSRIGLAESRDGLEFKRNEWPVLFPDNDAMKTFEWEGGCEDPRVVRSEDGKFIMTYTAYDGDKARLCLATSPDLIKWEKKGLAFADKQYRDLWSKSGAIVCERKGAEIVARKIKGKYWMYWGDTNIYAATSDDLFAWTPLVDKKGQLVPIMRPRPGLFDSKLVEPGPFALIQPQGILLLYNSANDGRNGDKNLPDMTYSVGQALFTANRPDRLAARTDKNFLQPELSAEKQGQVNNVCFLEGMVWFRDRWLLYYGMADSKVGVAEIAPK